ncbi:MAG TPA: hypothetical protein VLZ55_12360, partial [Rhodanobacter sp.]|nr:hypothetical protein [Rhodanobacter sp.]
MKFGQRIGIVQIDDVMQTTGINDALRNSLWNVLDNRIWSVEGFETSRYGNGLGTVDGFSRNVWSNHFKLPVDTRPEYGFQIVKAMRKHFFGCQWYEVYEFIEFVLLSYNIPNAVSDINAILERELA